MSKILAIFLVMILGFGFAWRLKAAERNLPKVGKIRFVATVRQSPNKTSTRQLLEFENVKVYTALYPAFSVGDRVEVYGEVDGQGRLYFPLVKKISDDKSLYLSLLKLREKLTANVFALLPQREATLVAGAVMGIDNIDRDFRDQLIKTGTIHVVVVSGQNLAIVAGLFVALARYIGRKTALILAVAASVGFATFAGLEPPVVRATIMVLVSSLAVFWGREANTLWTIFLAAFLILFWWPTALFEVSFQLTFAATLGIATLGKYLASFAGPDSSFFPISAHYEVKSPSSSRSSQFRKHKTLRADGSPKTAATRVVLEFLIKNAAVATSAFVFTTPIILWHFDRVSLLSPIANLLVAEVVFVIMVLGIALALASLIFMPLAQLIALFVFVPTFYFVKVVEFFAGINIGQITKNTFSFWILVFIYLAAGGACFILRSKTNEAGAIS